MVNVSPVYPLEIFCRIYDCTSVYRVDLRIKANIRMMSLLTFEWKVIFLGNFPKKFLNGQSVKIILNTFFSNNLN